MDRDRDVDTGKDRDKAVTKSNRLKGGNMTDDAYQAEAEANMIHVCERCGAPCWGRICEGCMRGGYDDFYSRYFD